MRKSVVVCALVPAALGMLALMQADQKKTPVVWPASTIKWTDSPDVKGVKVAVLWGDAKKGPYALLRKLTAGTTIALHTHSSDHKTVMVSGTFVLTLEGSSPKELAPGSYAFIPAGLKHAAECKPGTDCVFFEEATGPVDIKFVESAPAPKG